MSRQFFPLQATASPQVVQFFGAPGESHQLVLAFDVAPAAGTVLIEYQPLGRQTFQAARLANGVSLLPGYVTVRVDGPVAAFRVTFSGLSGGTAPVLWVDTQSLPAGLFSGLAALTTQSYTETNVKNGVQYEISSNVPSLANGASIDTIFITGARQVVVKNRIVRFNGVRLLTRVYRAPTYTGGTPAPYFNLNDADPVPGGVTVLAGAAVSDPGVEFGAPTYDIGSSGTGNASLSTFSVFGLERVLAPNTPYLQRITNDSGSAQRVSGYLTWYEGDTDLPL